ncbi:hypothetical protein HYR99_35860 [Candidatus Poribacteria bacterium]|nr:hypothetical protein [Candidatus Poribacteria bacterium]
MMEDIFYFSKVPIKLEEIAAHAEACGYLCKYYTYSVRYLNIYYEDHGFWQWSELKESDGDFDSFDHPQREKMTQFQLRSESPQGGPASAFLISYRVSSLPKLLWFLKLILGRYGGWIGCDEGHFNVTSNFENIEKFRYPYPDEEF